MNDLAPIGIVTYSRINHLKQTVKALQQNTLAKKSELYIYLDAPKQGDEKKVAIVREYIHTINGFKKVNIIERTTNNIIANITNAIKTLLNRHGKMIFMEDDIVTAPGFLNFINDGLNFYKNNKKIVSINGYNIPAKFPKNYKHDYYLSRSFNAWGFATWSDRGLLDVISYNDAYNEIIQNKKLYKKIKNIHPKIIAELKKIQDGILDAADYKVTFHLIKNDLYSVKPIRSFVNNIGHDGSGVHCGKTDKFNNKILNQEKILFEQNLNYNIKIDKIRHSYLNSKTTIYNLPKKMYNKLKKLYGKE